MESIKKEITSVLHTRDNMNSKYNASAKVMRSKETLQYSVLMSVYAKASPAHLTRAIQSIMDQTVKTDDFVLVCDGPLTEELNAAIAIFERNEAEAFHVVRLMNNVGTGLAANSGLRYCKHELIARMDADDIANPDRCELQLKRFLEDDRLVILGGQLLEFENSEDNIVSIKTAPLSYEKILKYGRRRSPFNNQTVMYKKSAVLRVGGYKNLSRCEDYDLFVRMLRSGYYGENLPDALGKYRIEKSTYKRRKSKENMRRFISVRWEIHKCGFSSFIDFILPTALQIVIFISPIFVQRIIYIKILRRRPILKAADYLLIPQSEGFEKAAEVCHE